MSKQSTEKQVERMARKLSEIHGDAGSGCVFHGGLLARYVLSLILPLVEALEEIAEWKMGESPSNTLLARNALATLKKEGIIE